MAELNWRQVDPELERNLIIASIDDTSAFEAYPAQTVVLSEGWVDGPVAAILRGGINAREVLRVLAGSGVTEITIYHIVEKIPQLEEIFLGTVVTEANRLFDKARINWRHDASLFDLVRSISPDYRMLFLGAPLAKSEIAPLRQRIKEDFPGSLTIVRGPMSAVEFDSGDAIFGWVRQQTFEAADFALPGELRDSKKRLDRKIAVILPALNEEKTIAKVIEAGLEVKNVGLIDEMIVIDSASTDQTVPIARSYGIPVFCHREIRPDLGAYRGKGEAMYKSAFVTDADILLWVDTDIENITPPFFYGLLGPLLTNPAIRFVKGYFSRPVRVEANGIELGGGRVTEILARPWINTFLPELSGFIQPLSGTVAIYRELFQKMRIPTNYGVEIAMLIQALDQIGLWGSCQVNLGEVVHKSKDVMGLSEMAFQIIQVLQALRHDFPAATENPVLRHVFSAGGRFEISLKRFHTYWREFQPATAPVSR